MPRRLRSQVSSSGSTLLHFAAANGHGAHAHGADKHGVIPDVSETLIGCAESVGTTAQSSHSNVAQRLDILPVGTTATEYVQVINKCTDGAYSDKQCLPQSSHSNVAQRLRLAKRA
jgi:hypothetical protein